MARDKAKYDKYFNCSEKHENVLVDYGNHKCMIFFYKIEYCYTFVTGFCYHSFKFIMKL